MSPSDFLCLTLVDGGRSLQLRIKAMDSIVRNVDDTATLVAMRGGKEYAVIETPEIIGDLLAN